jgi:hypothetical protein
VVIDNLPGTATDQAVAKVVERLVGGIADGVIDFSGNLLGGLFADRIGEWRRRNFFAGMAKTAEHLRSLGVPPEKARALPMGEVYAIFEGTANQDDPDVADMWAALLANAMGGSSDVRASPALIDALRSFSGLDAQIVRFIADVDEITRGVSKLRESYPEKAQVIGHRRAQMEFAEAERKQIELIAMAAHEFLEGKPVSLVTFSLSHLLSKGIIAVIGKPTSVLITRNQQVGSSVVRVVDAEKLERAILNIQNLVRMNAGLYENIPYLIDENNSEVVKNYTLTPFGKKLLDACTVAQQQRAD